MRYNYLIILPFFLLACAKEAPHVSLDSAIKVPAGEFIMGSDRHYPEERSARIVSVGAFDIDITEVTNSQFAAFVEATGYVTDAERSQPGYDVTGGAVFVLSDGSSPGKWDFIEGAHWRQPEGPGSSIESKDNEPVVQISLNDAKAYANWAGRRLPTEAEWEYAAKSGSNTDYVWGDELTPEGREQANRWQGMFPYENLGNDGFELRAPVGSFPANRFGLYDMIGNVWEWTDTPFQLSSSEPIHVIKGGSFLCAENYCQRYRASARQPQEAGLPTNHIGFRTVADVK